MEEKFLKKTFDRNDHKKEDKRAKILRGVAGAATTCVVAILGIIMHNKNGNKS